LEPGRLEAAVLLAVAAGASRVDEVSMLLGVPVEEARAAVERLVGEGLLRLVKRRRLLLLREERLELTERGRAAIPLARSVLSPLPGPGTVGGEEFLLAVLAGLAAEAALMLSALLSGPMGEPGGLAEDTGAKRSPIVFDPDEWR